MPPPAPATPAPAPRSAERCARDVQHLLDAVDEALLLVDRHGCIRPAWSGRATDWFGAVTAGQRLVDYLALPATLAARVQLALMQVGTLPFAVVAAQIAVRFERDGRPFDLSADPARDQGKVVGLVVRVRCARSAVRREEEARASRELASVVRHLARNEAVLRASVADLADLMGEVVAGGDDADRSALVHSAKGQAAMLGLERLAAALHGVEAALPEGGEALVAALAEARTCWVDTRTMIRTVLPPRGRVSIGRDELDLVITAMTEGRHAEALRQLRSLVAPSVAARLRPLVQSARDDARRLGKQLVVTLDADHLHLPYDGADVLVLGTVHLLRNAVAHGIESPAERRAAGKTAPGRVHVEAWWRNGRFGVTVGDDGAGIDWDAVQARARALGRPADTRNDLITALLDGGLSTRGHADDVSGRGQGLAAVRQLLRPLLGHLDVWSKPGDGSSWTMSIADAPPGER